MYYKVQLIYFVSLKRKVSLNRTEVGHQTGQLVIPDKSKQDSLQRHSFQLKNVQYYLLNFGVSLCATFMHM